MCFENELERIHVPNFLLASPFEWLFHLSAPLTPKHSNIGDNQQMYFIVHLQNNNSTKSQSTDRFSVGFRSIWKFHNCSKQSLRWTRGETERVYNQTFIRWVHPSAGTLLQRNQEETEKFNIHNGLHSCRNPDREALGLQASFQDVLAFPTPPLKPSNTLHLCFRFLLYAITTKSATVVNASPKSIHMDKKLAHSRRRFVFFFRCNRTFFCLFSLHLWFFFFNPHKYNIFSLYQEPTKEQYRQRYLQNMEDGWSQTHK